MCVEPDGQLHVVWFTNKAGWDRNCDHAATLEEINKGSEGRTLCGRKLGPGYVTTLVSVGYGMVRLESFHGSENFECATCRKVAAGQAETASPALDDATSDA